MSPRDVPMAEAKEHLPRLVREVARGDRMTITVHGRPQADLVPHGEGTDTPRAPRPVPDRVRLEPGPSLDGILEDMRGDR